MDHAATKTSKIMFNFVLLYICVCSDKEFYRVQLPSGLDAGKTITVDVEAAFAHALTPYPSQITQAEKQYVIFEGNLYFYSPYKTLSQKTSVTTSSTTLESYTKTKPVSLSENVISYGPYEEKPAFSEVGIVDHRLKSIYLQHHGVGGGYEGVLQSYLNDASILL